METWYRAMNGEIEAVSVVASTEKTVRLEGQGRDYIDSDWRWFRRDREQAKAAMVAQYAEERDAIKRSLERAEQRLADAQNA